MMSRDTLTFILQGLGFLIDFQKSILNSSHQIQLLRIETDSLNMIVFLPLQKKEEIILQYEGLLNQSDVTLRQMIQLLGRLQMPFLKVGEMSVRVKQREIHGQQWNSLLQMLVKNPILRHQAEYFLMGPKTKSIY